MLYSALIGKPVEHSVSPALFGFLAKEAGLEYGHLKIKVASSEELTGAMRSLQILGFCGANVTLPYKQTVIKSLDKLSPEAEKIGAVNTLLFKNGRSIGYNTDAAGALEAIEHILRPIKENDRVLLIGAGGAARAIAYSLYHKTKHIHILNRTKSRAQDLSRHISGGRIKTDALSSDNLRLLLPQSNFIINATSVGMRPQERMNLLGEQIIGSLSLERKYFFDAVFNPYLTEFLQIAKQRGAKICPGMYMMIYQAIKAFKIWTGKSINPDCADEANKILKSILKP